ncbi:MAG: SDR family oxidoreductase [Elusimicrobia bacterium]|nr:SDR family oxidoreductase [Elusimicrobiota bacterium]
MAPYPERVLVVGAAGLIGNALARAWGLRGATVLGADLRCLPGGPFAAMDVAEEGRLASALREFGPGVVALPAANPFVDYCEAHPEETRRVNVEAPAAAALECAAAGARLVFFSSDYVFDGAKERYAEEDPVCPINEYGRQKAEAERAVLAAGGRHLVVRSSGVYGWQWLPKNFVLQVLKALGQGKRLRVPHDIRYNPTYVENLAEVTVDLCAARAEGVFHVVGADRLARDRFAREVADVFGLDGSLIEPAVPPGACGRGTLPQAPRPKESSLATDKVRALVRTPLWGARLGLEDMLRQRPAWDAYAAVNLPRPGPI